MSREVSLSMLYEQSMSFSHSIRVTSHATVVSKRVSDQFLHSFVLYVQDSQILFSFAVVKVKLRVAGPCSTPFVPAAVFQSPIY
jgi:hypothetical protein